MKGTQVKVYQKRIDIRPKIKPPGPPYGVIVGVIIIITGLIYIFG